MFFSGVEKYNEDVIAVVKNPYCKIAPNEIKFIQKGRSIIKRFVGPKKAKIIYLKDTRLEIPIQGLCEDGSICGKAYIDVSVNGNLPTRPVVWERDNGRYILTKEKIKEVISPYIEAKTQYFFNKFKEEDLLKDEKKYENFKQELEESLTESMPKYGFIPHNITVVWDIKKINNHSIKEEFISNNVETFIDKISELNDYLGNVKLKNNENKENLEERVNNLSESKKEKNKKNIKEKVVYKVEKKEYPSFGNNIDFENLYDSKEMSLEQAIKKMAEEEANLVVSSNSNYTKGGDGFYWRNVFTNIFEKCIKRAYEENKNSEKLKSTLIEYISPKEIDNIMVDVNKKIIRGEM